jgi:threonine dehydratase
MRTMADGIAVGRPGEVPFEAVHRLVDDILTVSEESLSRALLLLLERAKQVVEPGGAAAVAALLEHGAAGELSAGPVVAVLSGGNIDPLLLMRVMRHGMAAAGRYLSFVTQLTDRPGELAGLLSLLADAQANVVDVLHQRVSPHLNVHEVELALRVETRGDTHREAVVATLRAAGHPVTIL